MTFRTDIGKESGGPESAQSSATIELATAADEPAIASLFLSGIKGNERDGLAWALENSIIWGFSSGVSPQSMLIRMHKDESKILTTANRRPIVTELLMKQEGVIAGADQKIERRFRNLRVLFADPAAFQSDIVTITDDRYRWDRPKVWMQVNLTRRVNDQIVQLGAGRRSLLRQNAELYRANTLTTEARQALSVPGQSASSLTTVIPTDSPNPRPSRRKLATDVRTPFTALDVIIEVLEHYLGYTGGPSGNIIIESRNPSEYIPQDIRIEGTPADAVIQRFLAMDGNDLYIDEYGNVVIQDAMMPTTYAQYRRIIAGGSGDFPEPLSGGIGNSDMTDVRPIDVIAQTVPEKEILFTFKSFSSQASIAGEKPATTPEEARQQIIDGRVYMENVTRTVIDGQVTDSDSNSLPAGTVVRIEDAFDSFGPFFGTNPISLDTFTEHYGHEAFAHAGAIVTNAKIVTTANIVSMAIMGDFRTLFRYPQVVVDELLSLNPVLANVLNNRSRTREPSTVFSRITMSVPSEQLQTSALQLGGILDSFFTYPSGVQNQPFPRTGFVPLSFSRATVEDFDLGLIRVNFGQDPQRPGMINSILPGVVDDKSYYELGQDSLLSARGAESISAEGLEKDWECSVVMSGVPFVENGPNRLYEESFAPVDFQEFRTSQGKGPTVFIPIRSDTARFQVEQLDYLSGPTFKPSVNISASRIGATGGMVNNNVIHAFGEAEAFRILRTFQDVMIGFEQFGMNDVTIKCKPHSSIRNIVFTHGSNGLQTVDIAANRVTTPEDVSSLLPEETLQVIAGQLDAQARNPQGGN